MACVLIVDDEEPVRMVLETMLQGAGYAVKTAADVAAAQEILDAGGVDVVVSDIYLTGTSGLELLRYVRMTAPRVPVILITGGPSLATATEAVRAGAFDYLYKPLHRETLLHSVALAVRVRTIEEERQRMADELVRARQEEDEHERSRQTQMRLRDEFLSLVSHELLTPLAAVHQFVSLVDDGFAGGINDEQHEYLRIARKNVGRLQSLIGDLLDVARARQGRLAVTPQPMDLHECLATALEMVGPEIRRKRLAFSLQEQEGLPPAFADPQRVQQIIVNLLNNAIKFTDEGGALRVHAGVLREDPPGREMLCVAVADTGCGICPEHHERIFDQLYQVNRPVDRTCCGLGLGLYICRDLITRQNGRIWVESRPGAGSTFLFTLPIATPDQGAAGGGTP